MRGELQVAARLTAVTQVTGERGLTAASLGNQGQGQPGHGAGGRTCLYLKGPSYSPGCDFPEIHRLSDMPPDLIVWFEKPANAVFAGDMWSGDGNRHEHTLRAMRR
jgi:hypothetical protein